VGRLSELPPAFWPAFFGSQPRRPAPQVQLAAPFRVQPGCIVLDESRECLYLVNTNANRVDIQNPRPNAGRVANKNRPHSISG